VHTLEQNEKYLRKLYNLLESIAKQILGSDYQTRMELINAKQSTILKIKEVEQKISFLKKKEAINKNG
jgi:hypothetical protein